MAGDGGMVPPTGSGSGSAPSDDAFEGRVADALRSMRPGDADLAAPPADLWARIDAEVRSSAGDEDGSAGVDGWGRRRRALIGAAAAVVLVLLATVAFVAVRSSDPDPVDEVAVATLSGAGLDPGSAATGTARLVQDGDRWTVELSVTDLPALGAGSYYEAWLLGPTAGTVQSLGTFEQDGDFVVPAGLDLDEFPTVDVSIEPLDGDPAHSARSVLRGDLAPA